MGSIIIVLKKVGCSGWQLFASKGNSISEIFHGNKTQAKEWARAWVSSFYNWSLKIEGEEHEEEDRVSR
jgi:hypothetical protein